MMRLTSATRQGAGPAVGSRGWDTAGINPRPECEDYRPSPPSARQVQTPWMLIQSPSVNSNGPVRPAIGSASIRGKVLSPVMSRA